jgi:hypothetical protein
MYKLKIFLIAASICYGANTALCWDGRDAYSGIPVEIGKGELVRRGRLINVYDYGTGVYHIMNVESITQNPNGTVTIEVYDHDISEFRELEMEND